MFNTVQQKTTFIKEHFNLSDADIEILTSKLPDKKKFQYHNHLWMIEQTDINLFTDFILHWKDSYNLIRGVEWPDCDSPADFAQLPAHIQKECVEEHKFSPEIWLNKNITYDKWTETKDCQYSVADIVRYKAIVLDNLDIISNKTLIDFACHIGSISLCCLHNGAKFITATNIRQKNIEIANASAELFGYQNNFLAKYADIHNYNLNTELCQNVDTVLLCGIMYHVHDHCNIINSITDAGPENIIIETRESKKISSSEDPLINWFIEKDENNFNGFYNNSEEIIVGYPNAAWFELAMKQNGYVRTNIQYFDAFSNSIDFDVTPELRSVQVFKKK